MDDASSSSQTTSTGPPDSDSVLRELAHTRLQVEAALDVVSLIDDMAEEHDERALVIVDIVDCWLQLSPDVRREYESWPAHTGLARFAGDYAEAVDGTWLSQPRVDPAALGEHDVERLCRDGWLEHIAQIRQRRATGAPPPKEWLARFATPNAIA